MSAPTSILDKLRNYEYEKAGCEAMVGDIYTLIHHVAALEEEIDALKAAAPRPVEGDGSDLPVGSIVVDQDGDAWQKSSLGDWAVTESSEVYSDLPGIYAPYTIIHTPTGREDQ